MKYDVSSRLTKLIAFDSTRKLKILEMFQYNIIGFLFVTCIAYFLENRYFKKSYDYFYKKNKSAENGKIDKSISGFLKLILLVMFETFFIIVILFYIRKLILLFPPAGIYMDDKFKGLTAVDYVIHITVFYLFLEFIPGYRKKTELILQYEFS